MSSETMTDKSAVAMTDPEAYRLKLPNEPETDASVKTTRDLAEFYDEFLELGRKRAPKVELFAEILDNWNITDAYYTLRIWGEGRLVHPMDTLDIGAGLVTRAVAKAYDVPLDGVEADIDEHGSVSRYLRSDAAPAFRSGDATIGDLYDDLRELAEIGGEQPMVDHVAETIEDLAHPWVYTTWLVQDLTFYVGQYQMRKAMSQVYGVSDEQLTEAEAINVDVPTLFLDLMADGVVRTELRPHDRMGNMKAQGLKTEEVMDLNWSNWVAQTKYDGARIFVHHAGDGDIRAYTTGKRDVTAVMPELQEIDWPDCEFIFDGEATPYDSETGEVKPFQSILRRIGRTPSGTMDADETDGLEVQFKFFDCPLWHGEDIRGRKFEDRYGIVSNYFPPPLVAQQGTDLEATFTRSIDRGHEGVVLKRLGHRYQPGVRSNDWQKWKAQPMEVDVVVTDANRGGGRISDRVGALRIAARGPDGELVHVGSVGTGMSDEERLDLWRAWESGELRHAVIQVNFEELQFSGDGEERGWALRFASYDGLRPDGEVDSLKHIAELDDKLEEFEEWAEDTEIDEMMRSSFDA